jgi:hypothetical protein
VICLENHYFYWQLEQTIVAFVQHYYHQRYHESLDNMTSPVESNLTKGHDLMPINKFGCSNMWVGNQTNCVLNVCQPTLVSEVPAANIDASKKVGSGSFDSPCS